jgi:dCMP deaminase
MLDYYNCLARVTATRSTCLDKQVGAVVVDADNKVVSTGYNGAPCGIRNCCDRELCLKEEGHACLAVHAEINALLQAGREAKGGTLYVTLEPCFECAKAAINAGITHIIYENYNGKSISYRENVKHYLFAANIKYTKYVEIA